jgi:cysteine desulfurase
MKRIYLDHAAGTPLDPRVLEAMLPFLKEDFGNPSSLHDFGQVAKKAVDCARAKVANLIGATPEEIIFTANGSEANNLALKGISAAARGRHIIISSIEHHSVMNAAKFLEKNGFQITYLPVDKFGLVGPDSVKEAIRSDTILVSVMHANNEIGTIEPLLEISKITKEKGVFLHTDAVSSAGTIPVNVKELGVDLLSMAANMFYGPKGIGALYIRKGVRIIPQIHGGIQERGIRAGTENVPAIVGLGRACEIAHQIMGEENKRLIKLRDSLIEGLLSKINNVYLNGHRSQRLPGNVNISVEFIEGESMLLFLNMQGIYVSSGSSCTSHALKASHVLLAIGVDHALAQGSLLFSLGRENTQKDIDYVIEALPSIVERLRQMSPLYNKNN